MNATGKYQDSPSSKRRPVARFDGNEDEPRDEGGKWTSGGSAGPGAAKASVRGHAKSQASAKSSTTESRFHSAVQKANVMRGVTPESIRSAGGGKEGWPGPKSKSQALKSLPGGNRGGIAPVTVRGVKTNPDAPAFSSKPPSRASSTTACSWTPAGSTRRPTSTCAET